MNEEKPINQNNKLSNIALKHKQKDWVKKLEGLSKKPIDWNRKLRTVFILIDCSGSMYGNKIKQAQSGALGYSSEAIEKGYIAGLIVFSSNADFLIEPQGDLSILKNKISEIVVSGSTNLTDALQIAFDQLNDKIGERVICIVTDGMPDNKNSALKLAKQAHNADIDIMTIGTDDADQEFLKQLSNRNELSIKVNSNQLEQGIISMAKLLPS